MKLKDGWKRIGSIPRSQIDGARPKDMIASMREAIKVAKKDGITELQLWIEEDFDESCGKDSIDLTIIGKEQP